MVKLMDIFLKRLNFCEGHKTEYATSSLRDNLELSWPLQKCLQRLNVEAVRTEFFWVSFKDILEHIQKWNICNQMVEKYSMRCLNLCNALYSNLLHYLLKSLYGQITYQNDPRYSIGTN